MKKMFFIMLTLFTALASCSKSDSTPPPPITPPVVPEAKVGDYYYSDGSYSSELKSGKTTIGIVFWLNAGNKSGKIVSLIEPTGDWDGLASDGQLEWRATQSDDNLGTANQTDGKANMTGVKNWIASPENIQSNTISDFPAFKWCADYATVGKVKGEWYLPAVVEARQFYAAMSGLKMVESGAGMGEINDWGHDTEMPDYANYATARATFNARFVAAGGVGIGTDPYWSSTNSSSTHAFAVTLVTGLSQDEHKLSLFNVRAIATF